MPTRPRPRSRSARAAPSPYVHVDNRGLILCNGPRCVCVPGSQLRTCAETFEIIAAERRATRTQGPHLVGGYVDGGDVVALRRHHDDLASVTLSSLDFDALRERWRDEAPAAAAVALLVFATPARAEEQLLTLYSPPIDSEPYVHKSTTVVLQARRRAGAERAGLRARLPGAGAGGQQGPGRQAAAGQQDDGPPLPLLHAGPGRPRPRRLPRRRLPRRARGGAPERALRRAWPPEQRAQLRHPQRDPRRHGAGVDADRDGHEPLPADQALLRAHAHLVHDRAAHAGLPGLDRRLPRTSATAWPTTCRAAASRARSSWTARRGRCRSARASSAAARTTTAARRTRRSSSVTCGRTLFDAKAYYGAPDHPYNTIRPILHEPGPDRQRHVPHEAGDPGRGGGGARARRLSLQQELHVAAMGFWVLQLVRDDSADRLRADADRPARGHQARRTTTRRAPFVYDRVVPQLDKPSGPLAAVHGRAVPVGDRWFKRRG